VLVRDAGTIGVAAQSKVRRGRREAKMHPMTAIDIPLALHRGESDLPFVDLGDGSEMQLLQCDVEAGLWVIRTRFRPGYLVQTHKHTGEVFAFTISGSWKYLEYPEVNTAGSYLFEPAGSVHTLTVPDDNDGVTDVWFAIRGANLNLDEDGNVTSVIDAGAVRDFYLAMCEGMGLPRPDVIGL
jgi:2,4'-dihydroxyacetophenone dioxygenase